MSPFFIIVGVILTIILSVGVPTLLLTYGFSLPWLKALAVTLAIGIASGRGK